MCCTKTWKQPITIDQRHLPVLCSSYLLICLSLFLQINLSFLSGHHYVSMEIVLPWDSTRHMSAVLRLWSGFTLPFAVQQPPPVVFWVCHGAVQSTGCNPYWSRAHCHRSQLKASQTLSERVAGLAQLAFYQLPAIVYIFFARWGCFIVKRGEMSLPPNLCAFKLLSIKLTCVCCR